MSRPAYWVIPLLNLDEQLTLRRIAIRIHQLHKPIPGSQSIQTDACPSCKCVVETKGILGAFVLDKESKPLMKKEHYEIKGTGIHT